MASRLDKIFNTTFTKKDSVILTAHCSQDVLKLLDHAFHQTGQNTATDHLFHMHT